MYLPLISKTFQVIRNTDYPILSQQDIDKFTQYATEKNKFVISGCEARVHPYRLMKVDKDGYDDFLLEIPQEIRGSRQRYPMVYQFVPALIAIPENVRIEAIFDPSSVDMFVMPQNSLLDKTALLDRLLIKSMENEDASHVLGNLSGRP